MRGIVPKTEANLLMHSDLWGEREGGVSRVEVVSYEAAKPTTATVHKKLKVLKGHPAYPWALQRAVVEREVTRANRGCCLLAGRSGHRPLPLKFQSFFRH